MVSKKQFDQMEPSIPFPFSLSLSHQHTHIWKDGNVGITTYISKKCQFVQL